MEVFSKTEKIRFQHIDQAGIVFYPRFFEMLNGLVEDWFEEALDLSFAKMHENAGIPTVDLQVQFLSPARLGQEIVKSLRVIELKDKSMRCAFVFTQSSGKEILKGEVSLVYVGISEDRGGISAQAFPENLREKIKKYL